MIPSEQWESSNIPDADEPAALRIQGRSKVAGKRPNFGIAGFAMGAENQ